ncbi:MBL fold metallo-hydrolase [Fulvivirga sedimenti]|uniref:MBL fold metallo-hydrolase n=1 Tax=Fulvivirga sedimenti TaxID=2879465 RepID=A0A9X1KZG6_9BACT|nr:MBL fold metallo-hydrolase [Fulvivirga sedimenti]MCA6074671.1 MBL fold metallo-hydrolase [Fulvivirga sedimenti]MCA6075848.1 MBL fold metallo-hydrolase [Fulvivirga sedimenti]MCA6076976.1 MBL fold metallo-hydrolase [Fulvivirga sedimenti]
MKQFGGKITQELKERYSKSDNWSENKFQNLVKTTMDVNIQTLPKILYRQFFETAGREPGSPLPIQPFRASEFLTPTETPKFIWYGHSVLLMQVSGKTILIDPMFGSNASPIAPFATKRFSAGSLEIIDSLPEIDLVLLTHDHYDHLDLDSMHRLIPKVKHFYTALGVGRHLKYWGVQGKNITEFDWWDQEIFHEIQITFTPSRHFSGRGLTDRAKSLWGGWVLKENGSSIYFSGDGGYGDHFKEVGSRLGPFDIGFMECGQYNEHWRQIHMFPEEAVQAGLDSGVKRAVPVHWGAFSLAQHTWKDPAERFVQAAMEQNLKFLTPRLGEQFNLETSPGAHWWNDHS